MSSWFRGNWSYSTFSHLPYCVGFTLQQWNPSLLEQFLYRLSLSHCLPGQTKASLLTHTQFLMPKDAFFRSLQRNLVLVFLLLQTLLHFFCGPELAFPRNLWLINSSGWRPCYRAKEPNSNPSHRRQCSASQFLATDRADSNQQACRNRALRTRRNRRRIQLDLSCTFSPRTASSVPSPARASQQHRPSTKGCSSSRGDHEVQTQAQRAHVHLLSSRAAASVPPLERVPGESALQGEPEAGGLGQAVP